MIGRYLFTFVIGLALAFAVLTAWSWPLRASIIVLTLGGVGVVLALIQFALDLMRAKSGSPVGTGRVLDTPQVESGSRWRNLEAWGWIIAFYLAIHVIGFMAAAPIFTFAYAKIYGAGWRVALVLSAVAWGFLYGIFEKILHVPWPEPLLKILL